jgi:hypothetical protein
MTAYNSLNTQIEAMKTKMTTMVAAATTSQDMIYMAKALGELGTLLGVDDIVDATAAKITELETKRTTSLADLESSRSASVADVNSERTSALGAITTARDSALNQISGAGSTIHPFLLAGV